MTRKLHNARILQEYCHRQGFERPEYHRIQGRLFKGDHGFIFTVEVFALLENGRQMLMAKETSDEFVNCRGARDHAAQKAYERLKQVEYEPNPERKCLTYIRSFRKCYFLVDHTSYPEFIIQLSRYYIPCRNIFVHKFCRNGEYPMDMAFKLHSCESSIVYSQYSIPVKIAVFAAEIVKMEKIFRESYHIFVLTKDREVKNAIDEISDRSCVDIFEGNDINQLIIDLMKRGIITEGY